MGCQLPTSQWEALGLPQAEKQGGIPDKDPFHRYCYAGSTTCVTAGSLETQTEVTT